jgi:hypothetical protein
MNPLAPISQIFVSFVVNKIHKPTTFRFRPSTSNFSPLTSSFVIRASSFLSPLLSPLISCLSCFSWLKNSRFFHIGSRISKKSREKLPQENLIFPEKTQVDIFQTLKKPQNQHSYRKGTITRKHFRIVKHVAKPLADFRMFYYFLRIAIPIFTPSRQPKMFHSGSHDSLPIVVPQAQDPLRSPALPLPSVMLARTPRDVPVFSLP